MRGLRERIDYTAEIARRQDVGERMQERAERVIGARRRSELFGAYLVRPVRDGDGADLRQGRLGRHCVAVAVPAVYDFRYRLRVPNDRLDLSCSMIRRSSSDNQISALPFSEKMPF